MQIKLNESHWLMDHFPEIFFGSVIKNWKFAYGAIREREKSRAHLHIGRLKSQFPLRISQPAISNWI